MHTLICVTFSLPPRVRGLVAYSAYGSSGTFMFTFLVISEDAPESPVQSSVRNNDTIMLYEPTHEIMALIARRNLNLQTRMRSHPLGLHI